ncbi:hypothetical protein [Peribacillus glennii]|uniref:Uncharacterized protein n=1 Tax=Peribacillus glennii TaxID=2303991 RepID=A0A372LCN7_9BACI|nr:hypothetical protein [Peribacillus glennii]RFU63711.1 hypothetical protein D0466_09550 [Peribacillus glennii]
MLQQFEELKRKIYLVAFPFFGFSLVINQVFYKITHSALHFEDFLKDYPPFCMVFDWLGFIAGKKSMV